MDLSPSTVSDTLVANSNASEMLFEKPWDRERGYSNSTDSAHESVGGRAVHLMPVSHSISLLVIST